jgi:hypothetical protein
MVARTISLAALLAFAALGSQAADMVYKSIMPDGRVMYGESPMPGAKRVDKVAPPPEKTGVLTATAEDKARASQIQPPPGPGVAVIPNPEKPMREWAQQGASQGSQVNPSRDLTKRSY